MHTAELITFAGFAAFVTGFLFALTASSFIDDQSPVVTLRQEWAALKDAWDWLRSVRLPALRRRNRREGGPRHARAVQA